MAAVWWLHHVVGVLLPGLIVLAAPVITLGSIIIGAVLFIVSKVGDYNSVE